MIALSPGAATIGLGIGLVLALACYLATNLSPGGMISPGWLALALMEDWRQAVLIVAMTAAVFGAAAGLRRVAILYGRRLFTVTVLLSVVLQATLILVVLGDAEVAFAYQTLGFVVPGLIAYQLFRQPPTPTLLATGTVSTATWGVLAVATLL